jgi:hypothetical protein
MIGGSDTFKVIAVSMFVGKIPNITIANFSTPSRGAVLDGKYQCPTNMPKTVGTIQANENMSDISTTKGSISINPPNEMKRIIKRATAKKGLEASAT